MKSEHNEELLKLAYKDQRAELEHRRNREHQIFGWTASILLAIIAALFIKSPATEKVFQSQNIPWRLLVSAVLAGLTIYSISWQHHQRKNAARHQRMLIALEKKLGYFDRPSPIYPKRWLKWGIKYVRLKDQLKYPSKISATASLGIVGLIAIWIDLIFKMN